MWLMLMAMGIRFLDWGFRGVDGYTVSGRVNHFISITVAVFCSIYTVYLKVRLLGCSPHF